eukprot:CAMPEP_0198277928 /NCGR_PEP_ID=MMETSP1447-20131203/66109_1 /TAXON_ID=420782 /ORGANISM="Chaetoceros dichaeta, Strain CCMP1751" /LENGTH=496 /DNA_ID=CAMNT_0043972987 /DNA_START=49 /DNA_END=1541 /DNA_ORIENTATION=-
MTTVASTSEQQTPQVVPHLSDYEQLRLNNIHRNETKLKQLGLLKPIVQSVHPKRRATKPKSSSSKPRVPSGPKRTSTRTKRKVVSYYSPTIDEDDSGERRRRESDDESSDYDEPTRMIEDDDHDDTIPASDEDDEPIQNNTKRRESDDESSDYDEPTSMIEDDDHDDTIPASDEDDEPIQNNTKRSRRRTNPTRTTTTPKPSTPKPNNKEKTLSNHNTDPTALGGILCETAKSSRSTCRKCRVKIEKDTPRVGMQAWIVGRQALTWQCPPCFLANVTCVLEKTGRGRCQLTRENFGKGELKVGVRSHTATFWYGLEVVGQVLGAVLAQVRGAGGDETGLGEVVGQVLGAVLAQVGGGERDKVGRELVRLDRIEGSDAIGEEDCVKLQTVLMNVVADIKAGSIVSKTQSMVTPVTPVTPEPKASDASTVRKARKQTPQPEIGCKSGMKGKVEWKFGGHLCYGTLLPSNETFTHCYARTHKGNVKTLAKGKGYWSIIG